MWCSNTLQAARRDNGEPAFRYRAAPGASCEARISEPSPPPVPMVIEQGTDMIELRPYRDDDIDRLVLLADNERVSRYLTDRFPYPYTRADAQWWITAGAREIHTEAWAIELDGELIGGIGITVQDGWRQHVAEIGYWLGEPYWGRGLAAEAVRRVTALTFENPPIDKIFAPVLGPNFASMRVLEKNGYQCEGVLREEVFKRGSRHDLHIFAILRT